PRPPSAPDTRDGGGLLFQGKCRRTPGRGASPSVFLPGGLNKGSLVGRCEESAAKTTGKS
ncbi:MAG: hypothetical protein J6C86_01310, partial [Bacteroidaceae bacterium]|nr:hypothetical protein [Bacteroidaceae bacterium]